MSDRPASTRLPSALLQRTYSGLLDDSLLRYNPDVLGARFFNKMIVKNLLFGGGIYLNDGYLVNHPVARAHLRNDRSLLRVMIATNFIRILTRAGSPDALIDMPHAMARSGNASFIELTRSAEWDDFSPVYTRICEGAFYAANPRPWPNYDMSIGYTKLIGRIFDHAPSRLGLRLIDADQLSRLRAAYFAERPEAGNSRHKYEVAVRAIADETRAPVLAARELMDIGNQAYHYNFGLALTAEEDDGIAVDTTVGMAFDELLRTRAVERGQLENIPLVRVPDELPLDEGELFWPFTDPSSEVARAKRDYLTSLDRLLEENATRIGELSADVREATAIYLDRLKSMFRGQIGEILFDIEGEAALSFSTGLLDRGDAVATAAPTAGLAVKLQAARTSQTREFLVERFRLRDVTADFNPDADALVRLGDIRPQLTSLAFDEAAARAFAADVPPVRT